MALVDSKIIDFYIQPQLIHLYKIKFSIVIQLTKVVIVNYIFLFFFQVSTNKPILKSYYFAFMLSFSGF